MVKSIEAPGVFSGAGGIIIGYENIGYENFGNEA